MALLLASLLLLPVSGEAIVKRNVFCSGCVVGERSRPAVRSALPLELVAIMLTRDGVDSAAVIVSQGQVGLFRVGERVGGAEVTAILARRVVLRVGDHSERLLLDVVDQSKADERIAGVVAERGGGGEGIRCHDGRCEVERALMQKLLADPGAMASWARVMPGPRGGLVLQMVRRGTPLAALGFESGDRLHALNGITLGGIEQMLQLYIQLKSASRVAVTVERQGTMRTVDYLVR